MHLRPGMGIGVLKFALGGLATVLVATSAHAEGEAAAIAGAIAGPVSSMVIAGIQASANKEVAAINAGAEVKKTEIMADVQSDANRKAAEAEMYRTQISAEIAAINQEGQTERQYLMSMENILATKEKYAAQREQAWMDYEFNVARLKQEEKQRDQQLALDKQYRDLQTAMGILAPTGTYGGLQITQVAQAATDTNSANATTLDSAGADASTAVAANSAQNRLTRNLSTTTIASKIASYRGGKSVIRSTDAPQLVLAANSVRQATPLVRGSRNSAPLMIAEPSTSSSSLVARAFTGKRSAGGIGHGKIGRSATSDTLNDASAGGTLAANEDGHHHQPH